MEKRDFSTKWQAGSAKCPIDFEYIFVQSLKKLHARTTVKDRGGLIKRQWRQHRFCFPMTPDAVDSGILTNDVQENVYLSIYSSLASSRFVFFFPVRVSLRRGAGRDVAPVEEKYEHYVQASSIFLSSPQGFQFSVNRHFNWLAIDFEKMQNTAWIQQNGNTFYIAPFLINVIYVRT